MCRLWTGNVGARELAPLQGELPPQAAEGSTAKNSVREFVEFPDTILIHYYLLLLHSAAAAGATRFFQARKKNMKHMTFALRVMSQLMG